MRRSCFGKGRLLPPFLLMLCASWGYAADRDWLACDAIDDDTRRLTCYDDLARAKGSTSNTAERKKANFGKADKLAEPEPDLTIESRIDRVAFTSSGKTVMYLANGQVWAENEPGRTRIRAGQNVAIKKGLFSYSMKLESGIIVTVKRLE